MLGDLPGKTVILGVLDLGDPRVETREVIVGRVRRALPSMEASRLALAPDRGMKYLPRQAADGRLRAMIAAAAILRREFGG